jgi:hypothetical protein
MENREIHGKSWDSHSEDREIHGRSWNSWKNVKFVEFMEKPWISWKIVKSTHGKIVKFMKFIENRVKFMDACEIHRSHEIHMNSLLANAHAWPHACSQALQTHNVSATGWVGRRVGWEGGLEAAQRCACCIRNENPANSSMLLFWAIFAVEPGTHAADTHANSPEHLAPSAHKEHSRSRYRKDL